MPDTVDLDAAERQDKRLILPGFEGFRMPRFYFNILSEAGSLDDGKEPSLLIWMPLAWKRCVMLAH
ncbi:hypothetical protein LJR245_000762 [Rhizobium leguminosarum]|uniref:hypothetical protein n=1 Tax=Rhizobium leguminosarum TaxID=384 RepID=UPI003ECF8015